MRLQLEGKTALVTGGGSGIGAETARMLAAEGASVLVTGRREQALRKVRDKIRGAGGQCELLAGDMMEEPFLDKLVSETVRVFGTLDILVCSAGMALRSPSLDMTVAEWDQVMKVNLTAPMRLSQAFIRQLQKQGRGGSIVYVSSTAGKNVNMGASPSYGASKAGLLYLTRHLAKEFASEGIRVNAVCPGPVETEITATWTEEHRQSVLSDLPLGRMGQPEDIAALICFLASPLSGYITGESVLINGGRYMR